VKTTVAPTASTRTPQQTDRHLLFVFGPVLAAGVIIMLAAMISGVLDWYPEIMIIIERIAGAAVILLTVVLFWQQARQHRIASGALDNAKARIGNIVESAMDAIITVDENGHIVIFNAAAEAIFGCPRSEALGAPLAWFIPERFRAGHAAHIKHFGETVAVSRRMTAQRVVTGLRRNGEEFPIDASISHMSGDDGRLYTVILRDVTRRVRAEEALQRSKDELRELASVGATAREQEKSRIARELHDELAQMLTALRMDLSWVSERLPAGEPQLAAKLDTMRNLLTDTVAATRRISADLRPLLLDDLGLVPAAQWLVSNFMQRTGIHCELAVEPPDLDLRDPHATAIFRILQESLTNVARHAQASLVDIHVNCSNGELMAKVRDNGRGFESGNPRKPNSYGLVGLRERAYLLDGDVRFDTAPGRGTTIEVRIPLQPAQPVA
jgi:PAS domain S-box-containing protein